MQSLHDRNDIALVLLISDTLSLGQHFIVLFELPAIPESNLPDNILSLHIIKFLNFLQFGLFT